MVAAMELEEQTLEKVGDRCEECGAPLTDRELQQVIESGGPTLCTIHAAEVVLVVEDEALDELAQRALRVARVR